MDNLETPRLGEIDIKQKRFDCLAAVDNLFAEKDFSLFEICNSLLTIIPLGFEQTEMCNVRLSVFDKTYESNDFKESNWFISSNIQFENITFGQVMVYYSYPTDFNAECVFNPEEKVLLNIIAYKLLEHLFKLNIVNSELLNQRSISLEKQSEWKILVDLLHKTDHLLFSIISRKMINLLFFKGIDEARQVFHKLGTFDEYENPFAETNSPSKKQVLENSYNMGEEIFEIASKYLSDVDILQLIQKWMYEEKSHFLVKSLSNPNTPLNEIADAVRRYQLVNPTRVDFVSPTQRGIIASLIRRFLTDQIEFINIGKHYMDIADFNELLSRLIFPSESHGKIGGKSSGIFLADKILRKCSQEDELLANIKTPKTWYLTSDGIINFIYYNNLEEVMEQKYKAIDEIRSEYPYVVQAFKNSHYSPEMMNGLSRALDDFGDKPIIVRSSSLLEDRIGSVFAGKYKSLFLGNQGSKQERLEALMDAISEVYASIFGPDPIGYRSEKALLDFNEEMGIMIQEVVGKRCGKYFFPAFAGVAFSNNEFRWSPRIKREDGLIRVVPGLGTRAVDRIGDDYPILIAPGHPELRVNQSFRDMVCYAPKYIDVINLETNTFETISIDSLIREVGNRYPGINEVFSILEENHLRRPYGVGIDTKQHDIVPTFENFVLGTNGVKKLYAVLQKLKEKLRTPVDIEFASDGNNFYLLQCRAQSFAGDATSCEIPRDVPEEDIVFTAAQHVTNGKMPDIHYIVYVDPTEYAKMTEFKDMKDIGIAVGKLNKMLPKRGFILMGPGRWGSRDDIKMGVSISYSDINCTAMLIEIAKNKGGYVPDLSFGTHFFQDLVEASIRYLPLYPDNDGIIFNEHFLMNSENILTRLLPEFAHVADALRVINVAEVANGKLLRVMMNGDADEALAYLYKPSGKITGNKFGAAKTHEHSTESSKIELRKWRKNIVERMAEQLDGERFGVESVYLFGTTYDETGEPDADIDLLFVFDGSPRDRQELLVWIEGWDMALREIYFQRTGYRLDKLLDAILVEPEQIIELKYYSEIIDPKLKRSKKLALKNEQK